VSYVQSSDEDADRPLCEDICRTPLVQVTYRYLSVITRCRSVCGPVCVSSSPHAVIVLRCFIEHASDRATLSGQASPTNCDAVGTKVSSSSSSSSNDIGRNIQLYSS